MPSPVPSILEKADGLPPTQIAWEPEIVPDETLFTVIETWFEWKQPVAVIVSVNV